MSRGHISAFEVTRQLAWARLGRRGPLYLVHALTARCNARCGFCAWNPDFYDPRDQLSTEQIEQLYTDARDAGFIGLSVWGGEPLLHKDFGRVMRHAKSLGLVTNMVTNGFLLERKLDDVLPNVDRICISLDHPSSEHDTMRKIPGLFDHIVSAAREVRRRDPKKPIILICTLQKANVHPDVIRELAELARSLGAVAIFNGMREEAASDVTDSGIEEYAAPQADLTRAFETVAQLKRRGYPILNSHTHIEMMKKNPPVYRCHWPKLMLPIEANGDVVDCMHWGTRPVGNLRETSLPEILKLPRLAELAGPEGEACHKCVSIHRVEISEVWEGNLEPVKSWAQLRGGARKSLREALSLRVLA